VFALPTRNWPAAPCKCFLNSAVRNVLWMVSSVMINPTDLFFGTCEQEAIARTCVARRRSVRRRSNFVTAGVWISGQNFWLLCPVH
jgi:hypothetical protein